MKLNTNAWNRLRYTAYVPVYDVVARRLAVGRRRSMELLAVHPGEHVLIDGCGTGLDLELLAPGVRTAAIDITPAMVDRTRERGRRLGIEVDARVMDAARLDFADESFDAVTLHLVLAVVPDPVNTAREAARVVRRGGRIAIFDKFLPDAGAPSLLRRAANGVTRVFATEINRTLGPMLEGLPLRIVHEEPSVFGGMFRVAICERT
jgi:phosphatidylethanolamine/phosphatidyl-N-methylethanolamine N-methyltransferase